MTRLVDELAGIVPGRREQLERIGSGLDERLRLAVVGRVSAGKSTLVNALIGRPWHPPHRVSAPTS